jgi:hypothetical protein
LRYDFSNKFELLKFQRELLFSPLARSHKQTHRAAAAKLEAAQNRLVPFSNNYVDISILAALKLRSSLGGFGVRYEAN